MDRLSRNRAQIAPQPSPPPTAVKVPRPWRVVASQRPSGPDRRNIGMPSVVPELSEMFKNDAIVAVRSISQPADSSSSPCLANTAVDDADMAREDDADVTRVADAWPRLPTAIRAAILAMIEATLPESSRTQAVNP